MVNTLDLISEHLKMNRSPRTIRTYGEALKVYYRICGDRDLTIATYTDFLRAIKDLNPSTQALYRSAVKGLYNEFAKIPASEFKQAERKWVKKRGKRFPIFKRDSIENLINYAKDAEEMKNTLPALRDRAFILTLADSGLRISEACSLRRGDLDWNEARAVIIGKGDKQAVVHFSRRSLDAIGDYLNARQDGASGKPLGSLPLFARHDKKAGKTIKPVESGGMWKAVKLRAKTIGVDKEIRIHDFRHYFVTMIYLATGDLKAAQELARHSDIGTTSLYAHAGGKIDEIYDSIFNRK